ncbi:MAG: hypothetical protein HQK52_24050 [Oligoflexia bacterium]|nr:hypothetical protein [Oligoflexia bacterium]
MTKLKNGVSIDKNQAILVGIDVHKNKWSVCIIHQEVVIGKFTLPGEFSSLKKLLQRYHGNKIYSV